MSEEVKVQVCRYRDRANLVLRYVDPTTGKQKTKSAGTADETEAERRAAVWQDELTSGRYQAATKVTWAEFRKRYEAERLPAQAPKTRGTFKTAANHLERVLNPDRLCKLTGATLSRFQALLRQGGMGEVTIGSTLRHLRAALSWGVDVGMLPAVPKMSIPRNGGARARAVSAEEVERMIAVAPKVRPHDSAAWSYYLRGLFAGGLRLEESLALSWADGPFAVDLTGGRRPAFVILAEGQKSRRDERLPMTEAFYNLLMETPPDQRQGKVFKLPGLQTGKPITAKRISRIVSKIGKRAGVVVATVEKRKRVDGELTTSTVKKSASAHDLRRGFCDYWSRRVPAPVLMKLARHREIATTLRYYVTGDCDSIGDMLWGRDWESGNNRPQGNILGNIGPESAREATKGPADESTEALENERVI